jgi:hypothetical protein
MSIYKKHFPIAIALLLSASQLEASMARQQQGLDERMSAVESELAAKRKVSPVVDKDSNFFVTGEYLLWHANECGLAYATKVDATTTKKGKVENVHFEWDSGFRVGLGYRLPHDKWELSLTWTGFSTDANGKASTTTGLIFPEWTPGIIASATGGAFVTEMNGKWSMDLNILDGEVGRYFMVTRKLALKPHFGLRGVWIDQDYEAKLKGGVIPPSSLVVKDHLKIDNDFKGVGLRAGVDSEWDLCHNLSIYGNAAYSLIYGHFKLQQHENLQTEGAARPTPVENIRDAFHQVVSIGEMAIGLRWDYTFANCSTALRLQAGWEFNAYFGQNKFEHFGTGSTSTLAFIANNEDLTTQGFVLSARVDF